MEADGTWIGGKMRHGESLRRKAAGLPQKGPYAAAALVSAERLGQDAVTKADALAGGRPDALPKMLVRTLPLES